MTSTPTRTTHLREGAGGRAVHDVGGLDFGPIDRHEHDLALWEKRTDAMLILLASRKDVFKIDAMRVNMSDSLIGLLTPPKPRRRSPAGLTLPRSISI